jgi:hypothetical protein
MTFMYFAARLVGMLSHQSIRSTSVRTDAPVVPAIITQPQNIGRTVALLENQRNLAAYMKRDSGFQRKRHAHANT